MDSVLEMLRPLSEHNKRWLADKLYEELESSSVQEEKVGNDQPSYSINRFRGVAKNISSKHIEEDSRLAYILGK